MCDGSYRWARRDGGGFDQRLYGVSRTVAGPGSARRPGAGHCHGPGRDQTPFSPAQPASRGGRATPKPLPRKRFLTFPQPHANIPDSVSDGRITSVNYALVLRAYATCQNTQAGKHR